MDNQEPKPDREAAPGRSDPVGYPVRFVHQIRACFVGASSDDVYMERRVVLPIPPSVGLEVWDEDWTATIEQLRVDAGKGTVEAWSEDKEIYDAQLHNQEHRPLDEIVAEYEECGWQREKRGTG